MLAVRRDIKKCDFEAMGSINASSGRKFDREAAAEWAKTWLFNRALPLFWSHGADRVEGGFFDKLHFDVSPVAGPKRVRVQARQIFVFAAAHHFGWQGESELAVDHGLKHMLGAYRRSDGLFASVAEGVNSDRAVAVDLYDQAFVILALAAAWNVTGRPDSVVDEAKTLIATLTHRMAHPEMGFHEAGSDLLPHRSNPHMHLLEALLAWVQLGFGDPFRGLANDIVSLATDRLIDRATGAIGEYYTPDWRPLPSPEGSIREPGHQFEWAYLLRLASKLLGLDLSGTADRLEAFGARHGLVDDRVIFATDAEGSPTDCGSRLWAQTEALRTYLISPQLGQSEADVANRFAGVQHFLNAAPTQGLWRERTDNAGDWIEEPVPASSLYHIVTGLAPLLAPTDPILLPI